MLNDKISKVKGYLWENQNDFLTALSFLLIALVGFGLGRLSALSAQKPPMEPEFQTAGLAPAKIGELVASKNGKAYYLPACSGADRIKEENKIWFSSRKEAENLGYKPAANCPGL